MLINPGLRRSLCGKQRALNSATLFAPLTKSLVLERGTGSPTFTRATTAVVSDNEGVLRTAIAGEARFTGARRVRNTVVGSSEDFTNANWGKANCTVVSDQATTPSGVLADLIYPTTSGTFRDIWQINTSPSSGARILSIDAKAAGLNWLMFRNMAASNGGAWFNLSTGVNGTIVAGYSLSSVSLGNGWYRVSLANTSALSQDAFYVSGVDGDNNTTATTSGTNGIYIARAQREDITGRTDQTTPSEYVSVGVLSAPYHGLGVDGVKCFDTDLSGNPLPTSPTYGYVVIPPIAGSTITAPNSTANQITGDIDIRHKLSMPDWTPASQMGLLGKLTSNGQSAYQTMITLNGELQFRYTPDGTFANLRQATSSVAVGFVDGSTHWIRCTYATATGKVNFYTSSDGITWTLLGVEQTITAGAIFAGTDGLKIDEIVATKLSANIYRAQIYNGINGTLAVDFDAARYNPRSSSTTLTGSTGETWPLNGSAYIHETNYSLKGYLAEGSATNLCLQSQTFGVTWTTPGLAALGIDADVAPDGTTTADRIIEDSSTGNHVITQAFTTTAQAYTFSIYAKQGTRSQIVLSFTGDGVAAVFDLASGTTLARNGFTVDPTSKSITPLANGWYRCQMTWTSVGAVGSLRVYLQSGNAANASYTGNGTGYVSLWGAQQETGSFATSYIPTTTVAVTRNADVLTYPSAGNISSTAGSVYAEYASSGGPSPRVIADSASSAAPLYTELAVSGGAGTYDGTTTVVSASFATAGTMNKGASTWTGATRSVIFNAGAIVSGAYDGSFGMTAISIGSGASANFLNGNVRNVRIWPTARSASEMQAITS